MSVDPLSAISLSAAVAMCCVVAGAPVAVALGYVLARREFFAKPLVAGLIMAPLVMPPVVTGLLLLELFGKEGALGTALASVGVVIPFSFAGAVLAAFVVSLPLYVSGARQAFESVDERLAEVAHSLGAAPRETFVRVWLPLAAPGIASGAALAFARALGEFGATSVLAGNIEGETRTISLAVDTLLSTPGDDGPLWLLVLSSIAIALAAVLWHEHLLRGRAKRRRT